MAKIAEPAALIAPIYLKQARIRHYAPLRDAKVNFKAGLNILIGPNGVGKTRFLSLISQLVNPFELPKIGIDCELVLVYKQEIKVSFQQPSIRIESASKFRNGKPSLKIETSYGTYGTGEETDDYLFKALVRWNIPPYQIVVAQHGTPLQGLLLADLPATLIFGGTAEMRVEPEISLPAYSNWPLLIDAIFNTIGDLVVLWRTYRHAQRLSTSFPTEEVRMEIEHIITAYLEFLNPILREYSPIEKVQLANTYQAYSNIVQQEVLIKGLVLEYFLDGNWIPFEALSDGTKRMLYLISQLVMPAAKFNSTGLLPISFVLDTPPRIIFLEEPELGIHPDQLQKLLSLIREVSEKHQVIMTTYSPQVLNMLTKQELDRITICELDPKKGTQFRKLSRAKQAKARAYMRDDSYLSDFWLYSNLEAK